MFQTFTLEKSLLREKSSWTDWTKASSDKCPLDKCSNTLTRFSWLTAVGLVWYYYMIINQRYFQNMKSRQRKRELKPQKHQFSLYIKFTLFLRIHIFLPHSKKHGYNNSTALVVMMWVKSLCQEWLTRVKSVCQDICYRTLCHKSLCVSGLCVTGVTQDCLSGILSEVSIRNVCRYCVLHPSVFQDFLSGFFVRCVSAWVKSLLQEFCWEC